LEGKNQYNIEIKLENKLNFIIFKDLTDEKPKIGSKSTKNDEKKEDQIKSNRKFRIQTDWSDTGPNSMPNNETGFNLDFIYLLIKLN
jgi:hypothetical protein